MLPWVYVWLKKKNFVKYILSSVLLFIDMHDSPVAYIVKYIRNCYNTVCLWIVIDGPM